MPFSRRRSVTDIDASVATPPSPSGLSPRFDVCLPMGWCGPAACSSCASEAVRSTVAERRRGVRNLYPTSMG